MIKCAVRRRHLLRKGVKVIYREHQARGMKYPYFTWMPADEKHTSPRWLITDQAGTREHHPYAWLEGITLSVLAGDSYSGYVLYKE